MQVRKIYNFYQANYLIENGSKVVGCGKDSKTNYILFEFNDTFDQYMEKWRLREK